MLVVCSLTNYWCRQFSEYFRFVQVCRNANSVRLWYVFMRPLHNRLGDILLLQVLGRIAIVSTLGTIFSSPTTRIILIFRIHFSITSIFTIAQQMVAGLCKTGKALTDGRTLVTSTVRHCASRKRVRFRSSAPELLKTCTLTPLFGEATTSSTWTIALAPSIRLKDGVHLRTMVDNGFK